MHSIALAGALSLIAYGLAMLLRLRRPASKQPTLPTHLEKEKLKYVRLRQQLELSAAVRKTKGDPDRRPA